MRKLPSRSEILKLIRLADSRRELSGIENYKQSLTLFDQALELLSCHDSTLSDIKAMKAECLAGKSKTLRYIGGPKNLYECINLSEQSIKLLEETSSLGDVYIEQICFCISHLCMALRDLGGNANIARAIAEYEKSTRLRSKLDLSVPLYRMNQSNSYAEIGHMLGMLEGEKNHDQALKAFDKAIALRRSLGNSDEAKSALAMALYYKSTAISNFGKEDDKIKSFTLLDEAIAIYKSIKVKDRLSQDRYAKFITDWALISAELKDKARYEQAITFLSEAAKIRIPTSSINKNFDSGDATHLAKIYMVKLLLLIRLHRWEDACDTGDLTLSMCRMLAYYGHFVRKSERQTAFSLTLEAYYMAGLSHFIPEILEEELSPHSKGAAWDEMDMHLIAISFTEKLILNSNHHNFRENYKRVNFDRLRSWLASLTGYCFAGTSTGAYLRASMAERKHELPKVLEIMSEYIKKAPQDPQGYLHRASFCYRFGKIDDAIHDQYNAILLIVEGNDNPYDRANDIVGHICESIIRVKFTTVFEQVPSTNLEVVLQNVFDLLFEYAIRQYNKIVQKLDTEKREIWEGPLQDSMIERSNSFLREQRSKFIDSSLKFFRDTTIKDERLKTSNWLEYISHVAITEVPQPWRLFAQRLLLVLADIQRIMPLNASSEMIDHLTRHAISSAMDSLDARTYLSGLERLRTTIRDRNFAQLDDREKRYLAIAFVCASDSTMAKFTSLEVGCALEYSLNSRLFYPIRLAHINEGKPIPPPSKEDHDRIIKLYEYLIGNSAHVMLGPMVIAFSKIVKRIGKSESDNTLSFIGKYLTSFKGSAELKKEPAIQKERANVLEQISLARNAIAHPKYEIGRQSGQAATVVSHEDAVATARKVLYLSVEAPDIAFFRYFPKLFVS